MYKITIFYGDKDNLVQDDKSYFVDNIDNIKEFEFKLINQLRDKGNECGYKEALIYVDLVKNENPVYVSDMEQAYIYRANNIDSNKIELTMAYHLSKTDEDEIIIEQMDDYEDDLRYNKKIMKIGGGVTGVSLTGLIIMIHKVMDSLRTTHSIKSYDFLLNSAIACVFAFATAVGVGVLLDGAIYYFKDKRKLKDKEYKLIKE